MTKTSGTKEWANSNVNFQHGCKNGCLYCYAAQMAMRFKRFKSLADWTNKFYIDEKKVQKGFRKRKGRIMFPTSHDITLGNIGETLNVLEKILSKGNSVLLTTKPDLNCIIMICDVCKYFGYQDQIQFRFTITSLDAELLKKWEPYAPTFPERIASLKYAFDHGFKTSVSIEPFLDWDPEHLIAEVEPYVTESIWLGLMNTTTLPKEGRDLYKAENMRVNYTQNHLDTILSSCQQAAKGKLRLKDSIRGLLNL